MFKRIEKMIDNGETIQISIQYELFNSRKEQFEVPEHWLNGKCGVLHLIVDDCQQTHIYRNKMFRNMNTRLRHIAPFQDSTKQKGVAIGISLHHCIQNFRHQQGLPKEIREDMKLLAIFQADNRKMIDELMEKSSDHLSKVKFIELFQKA